MDRPQHLRALLEDISIILEKKCFFPILRFSMMCDVIISWILPIFDESYAGMAHPQHLRGSPV